MTYYRGREWWPRGFQEGETALSVDDGYYAAFIGISGRRCVVIGGGEIAARKAEALARAGGEVVVVSPDAHGSLLELRSQGLVEVLGREYEPGDLAGAFMAVEATGRPEVVRAVREEATSERCLLNVVDDPAQSDFLVPSVLHRGPLQIAVSTSGAAPAISQHVRSMFEDQFGEEWASYVTLAGRVRTLAKERLVDPRRRVRLAHWVASGDLFERIRRGETPDAESVFAEGLERMDHSGPDEDQRL